MTLPMLLAACVYIMLTAYFKMEIRESSAPFAHRFGQMQSQRDIHNIRYKIRLRDVTNAKVGVCCKLLSMES